MRLDMAVAVVGGWGWRSGRQNEGHHMRAITGQEQVRTVVRIPVAVGGGVHFKPS